MSPRVDLTLSPAEEEFRDTLRAWIAENHPGREPEGDEASFEFRRDWQRKLNERGWAGLTWPTEYGGAGATQIEQAIFFEEFARARAPQMANVLGLDDGRPDGDRPRHRRAEGALPRADPVAPTRSGARASASRSRAPTSRR